MNTPSQTVRAFIRAHYAWNAVANERSKALQPGSRAYQDAMQAAKREYAGLVSQLCAPSVVPQGISFGDDPMHHPDHETIESESMSGHAAVVQTRNIGLYEFVSDYEYHLVLTGGEWRIASLLYVDQDGKYESL
jgi:hypothetical protein